jgi:D-arabinose 1-dehydrogenase-like Zn-dependent alcohol dehydrogenase
MAKMRAVQVSRPGGPFEMVERDIPEPGRGVRENQSSEDTLRFSVLQGVRSINEIYPLARAAEAYDRMMSGQARFRVVLTVSG